MTAYREAKIEGLELRKLERKTIHAVYAALKNPTNGKFNTGFYWICEFANLQSAQKYIERIFSIEGIEKWLAVQLVSFTENLRFQVDEKLGRLIEV